MASRIDPVEVWSPREVRRLSRADPSESRRNEPIVVTDAQEDWFGDGERWSIESLRRDYGEEIVEANDLWPLQEWDDPPMRTKKILLKEFASYARDGPNEILDGDRPWRASWQPFAEHSDLLNAWSYPYFVEDLMKHEKGSHQQQLLQYSKILVEAQGCAARLRVEDQQTHAWHAQIQGRKQFVLFSPDDGDKIKLHPWEPRNRRVLDPGDVPPDPLAYPRLYEARSYVAILDPGDTIFIPCGWWYSSRCLEPCVTLTRNFANSSNSDRFKAEVQRLNAHAKAHTPKIIPHGNCVVCNGPKASPCSRCRAVYYCGRECQRKAWRQHKTFCPVLVDLDFAAAKSSMTKTTPETTMKGGIFGGVSTAGSVDKKMTFSKHVLRQGKGRIPNVESMVRVNYVAYLADGQRIDSSQDDPYDMHVTRTRAARGWCDALRTMRVGERARIAVPPDAAYGDAGVVGKVPPHTALVFEVDLVQIW